MTEEKNQELFLENCLKNLTNEWKNVIRSCQTYENLSEFLEKEYATGLALPAKHLIFYSLELTPNPKVVILGQDPYYANTNEAMGLSFSVPEGVKIPASLQNIFKELSTDIPNFTIPKSGDLTKWTKEGVLLLNTTLTVIHKKKESHIREWNEITDNIISWISKNSRTPVVFMLWGTYARKKKDLILDRRHLILEEAHPSPFCYIRKEWFGCKHFSKCNNFLRENNLSEINWYL